MQLITSLTTTSLLLAGGALSMSSADSSATSMAPMPAESGKLALHVVQVSNKNGDLTFTPNDIKAATGDMVQFHFYPKNHSVVQSTFDQPCQPLEMNMPGTKGFFSGFMPVKPTDATVPSFTVMVKDATKPIWFYCAQGKHCQSGMVGAINAPAGNPAKSVDAFKALAAKATANIAPTMDQTSNASTSTSSEPAMGGAGAGVGAGAGAYNSGSGSNSTGTASSSGAAGGSSGTSTGGPATFTGAAATLASKGQMLAGAALAGVFGLAFTLL